MNDHERERIADTIEYNLRYLRGILATDPDAIDRQLGNLQYIANMVRNGEYGAKR